MARNSAAPPAPVKPQEQPQAPKPRRELATMLDEWSTRIQAAMPDHLSADRLVQVTRTLVYRTPKLQECDPATIVAGVMRAASLGLDLEPAMMEAFLIPRRNYNTKSMECTFQLGYQGVRKLALQSGLVASIETRLVRKEDYFELRYSPDLFLDHRPRFGPSAGDVVMVYGYAKLTNGATLVEVMTTDEVEAIHRRSEGYRNAQQYGKAESGPWVTDWNEMARKTVLKRLAKSLPRSLELAEAIAHDDAEYRDSQGVVVSGSPRRLGTAGLKERLAIGSASESEPEPAFTEGTDRPLYSEDEGDTQPDDMSVLPEPGSEG